MAIDKNKILKGKPIEITDGLSLYQPTIGEIIEFGEDIYFSTFLTMCSAPWDVPSLLDDVGIDFMEISEWDFFRSMILSTPVEHTRLVFGELDFTEFASMQRTSEDGSVDIVLVNPITEMIIDENLYKDFISYLREIVGFQHTGKKAGNSATKKILIMDDRKQRQRNAKKDDKESMIFDMVVTLVNTEEFSYDYESVYNLTMFQLQKSFTQIQGKKQAVALLQGSMSGFCDTSNFSNMDFSWVYSEEKYKPKTKKLINQKYK